MTCSLCGTLLVPGDKRGQVCPHCDRPCERTSACSTCKRMVGKNGIGPGSPTK